MGPLKMFFFLFAKTRAPDPLGFPQDIPSLKEEIGGWRTTRMFDGKIEVVGVAGSTLTE